MCNPKSSQISLGQQIADQSKKIYNQVPICLSEQLRIYRLQMGLLHISGEQNASLMIKTMSIILMKNNTSKENRKKYIEYYSRIEKQRSTTEKDIVRNETEIALMFLRFKD